jgi:hypothetical protein
MRLYILILVTLIACELKAQNYTRDCGLRFGEYFSMGYRQFVDESQAMEVILSAGRRGVAITVLKEYTQPAFGRVSENLLFVYGFGAHTGFRYADHYKVLNRTYELDGYRFMPLLGIDGYMAVEYRFPDFPVSAGMDFKPYFEYSNIEIFNVNLTGFGFYIKYRF